MHTLDRDFITWRVLRGIQISLEMRDFVFTQRFCRRFVMCWEMKENAGAFPPVMKSCVPACSQCNQWRNSTYVVRTEGVGWGGEWSIQGWGILDGKIHIINEKIIFSTQQNLYYLHTPWLYDPLRDSLDLFHQGRPSFSVHCRLSL
jgi:hypothetical protein